MSIKFEKIKAGDTLYDNHRTKMGHTTMSCMGEWSVKILEVDTIERTALVSWNHNKATTWYEYQLTRLYATPLREREEKRRLRKASVKGTQP